MTKLSKYTLEYNEQKERWDLTKDKTDTVVKTFGKKEATRRAAKRRNLLQPERSTDCHRAMAKALQHHPTALIAWIPTAGAADNKPVPTTARSGHANAIVSQSRWYKKAVRPPQWTIKAS